MSGGKRQSAGCETLAAGLWWGLVGHGGLWWTVVDHSWSISGAWQALSERWSAVWVWVWWAIAGRKLLKKVHSKIVMSPSSPRTVWPRVSFSRPRSVRRCHHRCRRHHQSRSGSPHAPPSSASPRQKMDRVWRSISRTEAQAAAAAAAKVAARCSSAAPGRARLQIRLGQLPFAPVVTGWKHRRPRSCP